MSPLPPLKIGPVEIGFPVVQAALSGYSDWPMRVLARRYGASYALNEVMLDRFAVEVKGRGKTQHYLRLTDEEHPVGGQLMGADPDAFPPAARRLVECGFDVIDINFGCPVKSAMGGCRGGYHLSQPDVALEIVRRVRDAVPDRIPVSVKMRRGIDDTAESRDRFFRILDGAFAIGVAAVTVHGRTVEQRYVGPSNWEFLREVKEHAGERTVLGSGDLFDAESCLRMIRETGVDGVTVARGAIANPWIFRQARALAAGEPLPPPPTVLEQRETMREHLDLCIETYGPRKGFGAFRKFAIKYTRLHPSYEQVRNDCATVRTLEEWDGYLQRWYSADAPGQYPLVDETAGASAGSR